MKSRIPWIFEGLLVGLLGGCSEQVRIVAPAGDIAVGARFRLAVLDSSCDNSGATSFATTLAAGLAFEAFLTSQGRPALALPPLSTAPSCRKVRIDKVSEATSSDPAILAVVDSGTDKGIGLVELEARHAGSTEVMVTVETAHGTQSATAMFHTAPVGRVTLTSGCPSAADPDYVPIGSTSSYSVELAQADGRPLLSFDYLPIDLRNLSISHPTQGDSSGRVAVDYRYLNVTWPTSPGDVTLTSSDYAAFRKTVTLYDQSAYTAVSFSPGAGTVIRVADTAGVRFDLIAQTGTRTSCWFDPIARHYYTDSPTFCTLSLGLGSPKATDLMASGVVVYGLAAGTCRLHAEVPNSPFAATIDIPIQ